MGRHPRLQLFVPDMIAVDRPGAVVVTGSKQGITLPPGETALMSFVKLEGRD
jgi:hypothetical protein